MGITRKQLKNFGATYYLSKRLTKALQPVGKEGREYEYDTNQVLGSIYRLMDAPKLRSTTKSTLTDLEVKVNDLVDHTFSEKQLLEVMQRMIAASVRFEKIAREARKCAEEFQCYKKKCITNFNSKNNIIVFNR